MKHNPSVELYSVVSPSYAVAKWVSVIAGGILFFLFIFNRFGEGGEFPALELVLLGGYLLIGPRYLFKDRSFKFNLESTPKEDLPRE